ncbi:hypothetical protein PsorP6_006866 [Peronosclerospora sorghi]|uniref:Uncharacterized protein n=1 Tax=Peronosclerospora sorghi TaxID=230839 RepID=A0ACC0WAV3_9STRA|nr:hypothetical protein PsorP6_006866 [Peronosclerospora sorghi]
MLYVNAITGMTAYGYYLLVISPNRLAVSIPRQSRTGYTNGQFGQNQSTKRCRKFSKEQKIQMLLRATSNVILDEAKAAFDVSVWQILRDGELTWKKVEWRAIPSKKPTFFACSFENRGMLVRIQKAFRGEFTCKYRVFHSMEWFVWVLQPQLAHLIVTSSFCDVTNTHSVWILKGTEAIRTQASCIRCGVSLSYHVYCPFYNPIKYFFRYVKSAFKRSYVKSLSQPNLLPFVIETLRLFESSWRVNLLKGLSSQLIQVGDVEMGSDRLACMRMQAQKYIIVRYSLVLVLHTIVMIWILIACGALARVSASDRDVRPRAIPKNNSSLC